MLGAVPAPAAAPRTARSLESLMDNLGESFTTRLLRLIDERGLKDSTVYKQSNISRQHFSKIQCNREVFVGFFFLFKRTLLWTSVNSIPCACCYAVWSLTSASAASREVR